MKFTTVLGLAAACSLASTAAFGCAQVTPPSAARKVQLERMKKSFDRLKAIQAMQLAHTTAVKSKEETAPFSMVGMWMTTFTSGGDIVDAGFDVWHSDGTQLLNDNPPPATGNVCVGVWQQTGPLTYELNHPSWAFDPDTNTNVVGIAYIREKVTLDPDGNHYTGTASIDGYDLDGNLVFHEDSDVSGDRITVDYPSSTSPVPQMRLYPFVK